MQKSKFIRLLKTLNKKEHKEFEQYLQGLHQGQATALKVFGRILKKYPDYNFPEKEKESILFDVFPGQKQAAKYLSNSLSDLFGMLNDFLLWKKIRGKSYHRDLLLLQVYGERNLDDLYLPHLEQSNAELQKRKKGDWFYLKELLLNHARFFSVHRHQLKHPIQALRQCMDSLDLFFLLTKLKYSCEVFNQSNILEGKNQYRFILPLPIVSSAQAKKLPILFALYRSMLQLIREEKQEDFDQLLNLLNDNLSQISRDDKANILGYLINYAIAKVRQGEVQFRKKIFLLYQLSLKEQLIVEDGGIPTTGFINIVIAACKLKKFTWLDGFLEEYGPHLHQSSREDVLNMSNAYILFEKKDFEAVIDLLQTIKFSTMAITLRAKSLILRSYYEHFGQEDITKQYIKSFENYLNRHKRDHPKSIKAYLNALKFLKVLFRKKFVPEVLVQKIKACEVIYFKDWLLEKALTPKRD